MFLHIHFRTKLCSHSTDTRAHTRSLSFCFVCRPIDRWKCRGHGAFGLVGSMSRTFLDNLRSVCVCSRSFSSHVKPQKRSLMVFSVCAHAELRNRKWGFHNMFGYVCNALSSSKVSLCCVFFKMLALYNSYILWALISFTPFWCSNFCVRTAYLDLGHESSHGKHVWCVSCKF